MNYQQVANYSVDPPLVATGQFFAATVMMVCQGPQHDAVKEESAMIGKILLTLAVIAVAYLMVRRDSGSKPDTAKSALAKSVADDQKIT